MSNQDYAALAASVLKRKPLISREPGLTRDRGIAVVAQAMHQRSRTRQRARMWIVGTCALAAAAAVLTISTHSLKHKKAANVAGNTNACGSSGSICAGTAATPVAVDVAHMNGRDILPGSVFQADTGKTERVHFDSGTHMSLDANTMVAYDEGASLHRFSISRGAIHLEVAKLAKGQRFLLKTLDAEVEVRGTVFDVKVVEPSLGCGQQTQVSVEEGVVEVRTSTALHTLRAGDRWPGDCSTSQSKPTTHNLSARSVQPESNLKGLPTPEAANAGVAVGALSPSANGNDSSGGNTAGTQDSPPSSALALQNDLYARATSERRLGHPSQAVALYQQLIARFPSSALVESAYVQRLRLLRQTHAEQAKAEARRYLQLFPQGFARTEALAIIDSP